MFGDAESPVSVHVKKTTNAKPIMPQDLSVEAGTVKGILCIVVQSLDDLQLARLMRWAIRWAFCSP
jgi:hypothetical protein